jgi:hypothetical protein
MTPIAELIGKLERATGPDRELDSTDPKPDCDCMVCRNRRHREAVWARHNAGQDYLGIRARIMEREAPDTYITDRWRLPK